MKRITKSRLNAIQNAGTMIDTLDMFSDLSDAEIEDHTKIGMLLVKYDKEVLKLLIKLDNE